MVGGIEVVEENASDSSRFFSVGDVKVLVAPLLEGTIECARGVSAAGVFEGLVEMYRVLFVYITWGQVASSSKPPSDNFGGIFWIGDLEVAVVRVDGRCVRVSGVDD